MSKEYISKDYLLKELEELNIVSFYELNEHSKEAYKEFKALVEGAPTKKIKEGVWVPGMEMPKNCETCPCRGIGLYRESYCNLKRWLYVDDYMDDENERPEWCPLQEVQE